MQNLDTPLHYLNVLYYYCTHLHTVQNCIKAIITVSKPYPASSYAHKLYNAFLLYNMSSTLYAQYTLFAD